MVSSAVQRVRRMPRSSTRRHRAPASARTVPRMLERRISSNSGHGERAENADADMGRAPAMHCAMHAFDDRRPDRAGDVIAAGGDRDRDAAPLIEPVRGSAISGAKVADAPRPISTCARSQTATIGAKTGTDEPAPTALCRSAIGSRTRAVRHPADHDAADGKPRASPWCKAAMRQPGSRRTRPARPATRRRPPTCRRCRPWRSRAPARAAAERRASLGTKTVLAFVDIGGGHGLGIRSDA